MRLNNFEILENTIKRKEDEKMFDTMCTLILGDIFEILFDSKIESLDYKSYPLYKKYMTKEDNEIIMTHNRYYNLSGYITSARTITTIDTNECIESYRMIDYDTHHNPKRIIQNSIVFGNTIHLDAEYEYQPVKNNSDLEFRMVSSKCFDPNKPDLLSEKTEYEYDDDGRLLSIYHSIKTSSSLLKYHVDVEWEKTDSEYIPIGFRIVNYLPITSFHGIFKYDDYTKLPILIKISEDDDQDILMNITHYDNKYIVSCRNQYGYMMNTMDMVLVSK